MSTLEESSMEQSAIILKHQAAQILKLEDSIQSMQESSEQSNDDVTTPARKEWMVDQESEDYLDP
ncbi:hypothetical protein PGT21_025617 [Puccinia graminis f. sp. tritici]|uniref:Uncharacterized protein n=1 Tax=Puccinia graminis f. sp. tritici TaxID=56615 RepID=A0A5B0LKH2_PUCGR|nr:hypothetical protein PGT21_025617 [Puccinia graminis f. sp. tritici]